MKQSFLWAAHVLDPVRVLALLCTLAILLAAVAIIYLVRWAQREHTARARAERLVQLSDHLQELTGAASRARSVALSWRFS